MSFSSKRISNSASGISALEIPIQELRIALKELLSAQYEVGSKSNSSKNSPKRIATILEQEFLIPPDEFSTNQVLTRFSMKFST